MAEKIRSRDSLARIEEEVAQKQAEREKEKRHQAFDAKLEELANKTVDIILQRGENDYLAEMMKTFLDVALEMKAAVELVSSVNVATSCIYEAIGFLDSALDFEQGLQIESLTHSYGFIERIKRKIRARRAVNNNMRRMNAVVETIMGNLKMANATVDMLKKMSLKMKVMMGQNVANAKKREEKLAKRTGTPIQSGPSNADKFIQQIMEKRGIDGTQTAKNGTDVTGGTGGSTSGASDISDII